MFSTVSKTLVFCTLLTFLRPATSLNEWTLSSEECQAPCWNEQNAICACCAAGGCQCGEVNPQLCIECGTAFDPCLEDNPITQCAWSDEIQHSFLSDYACAQDDPLSPFAETLVLAQEKCCDCLECVGVTFDPEPVIVERTYSIRQGSLRLSLNAEGSWLKDPEAPNVCDFESPLADAFLADHACGDMFVYDVDLAKERCCLCTECTGVVCDGPDCTIRMGGEAIRSKNGEVSHRKSSAVVVEQPSCDFDTEVADTFLSDLACDEGKQHFSLESAQVSCCECVTCTGVTCSDTGVCTTRSGSTFKESKNGETSHKRTTDPPANCSFGDEIEHTFLSTHACSDSHRYLTLAEAQHKCCDCPECAGVTIDQEGRATIRIGPDMKGSRVAESTYLKE